MNLNKNKGLYLALTTSLISGVSIFINKFAVDAFDSPLFFTALKNSAVTLLIISLLILTSRWKNLTKITKKDFKTLTLIGIVGGTIPFYLFFKGITLIPALNAALIHKTLVLWVALLAIPFLKEKITKWHTIAILAVFGGNVFVGGFQGFRFSLGELMVLAATIFWAIENIIAKKALQTVDSQIVVLFRMGIGSIILLVASYITKPSTFLQVTELTTTQIFWVSATVITLLLYVSTWYKALSEEKAITVATVLASSTLVTNILSAVFITKVWNFNLSVQTVLIVAGICILLFVLKPYSATELLEERY
ncbi:MAG: DMT family transporter [Patescibacteria group bacterium]